MGPIAPHIVDESVVVSLSTRDIHRCLRRAGLHDCATEESLVVSLIGDNLTADANTARALSPSVFGNGYEKWCGSKDETEMNRRTM